MKLSSSIQQTKQRLLLIFLYFSLFPQEQHNPININCKNIPKKSEEKKKPLLLLLLP